MSFERFDPHRILVGSRSNFGAPLAIGVGQQGSFLSIDRRAGDILIVPPNFAQSAQSVPPNPPVQPSTRGTSTLPCGH